MTPDRIAAAIKAAWNADDFDGEVRAQMNKTPTAAPPQPQLPVPHFVQVQGGLFYHDPERMDRLQEIRRDEEADYERSRLFGL